MAEELVTLDRVLGGVGFLSIAGAVVKMLLWARDEFSKVRAEMEERAEDQIRAASEKADERISAAATALRAEALLKAEALIAAQRSAADALARTDRLATEAREHERADAATFVTKADFLRHVDRVDEKLDKIMAFMQERADDPLPQKRRR